jgi:hypothetical protein
MSEGVIIVKVSVAESSPLGIALAALPVRKRAKHLASYAVAGHFAYTYGASALPQRAEGPSPLPSATVATATTPMQAAPSLSSVDPGVAVMLSALAQLGEDEEDATL